MSWLAFGITAGLLLAIVEIFFSSFVVIVLQSIGLTNQEVVMPFGIKLEFSKMSTGLYLLILLGFLRSGLYVCTGLSAVVSNEFFQTRLKLISVNKILNSTREFSSLSNISSMFAETFGKAAICFHSLAHVLPLSMQAILILFILVSMSLTYTLAGIFFLGVSGFVIVALQKIIQRISVDMPTINSNIFQAVIRIYKNWFLIKILQIEKNEINRFTNLQIAYSTKHIFSNLLALISANIPTAFGIILISSLIYYHHTYELIQNSIFISFLYLFLRFVQLLSQVANFLGIAGMNYPFLKSSWVFFKDIKKENVEKWEKKISEISIFQSKPNLKSQTDQSKKINESFPLAKKAENHPPSVMVNNLWFRYHEGAPRIFSGMNFSVRPGEQVVIMGPSGVGKSTFLALIMGILTPDEGDVHIDGQSPMDYIASNASLIAYVGSDPFLIEGTLRENLVYGQKSFVSDAAIIQSLEQVELKDWFFSIGSDLSYAINESATTLSTGQKQRLAIARAILRGPKLLILDEISANLDILTEEKIADTILKFKGSATVIIVTHRTGIAKFSDLIINLKYEK